MNRYEQHQLSSLGMDRFNLRNFLARYYRYKWFYIIILLLSLVGAWAYLWIKTPLYRIRASIVIKDEKKGEANSVTLKELDFLDEQKIVDNEAEIVKSESIIGKVVVEHQLNIAYSSMNAANRFSPVYSDSVLVIHFVRGETLTYPVSFELTIKNATHFVLGKDEKDQAIRFGDTVQFNGTRLVVDKGVSIASFAGKKIRIEVLSPEEVTQSIREGITLSTPTKNSSILNISMLHPSPSRGPAILAAILEKYNEANAIEKKSQTDTILRLIEGRLGLISGQLQEYEGKEEAFKTSKRITTLGDDSKMFLERARDNDKSLAEARMKLEILEALERAVSSNNTIIAPPQSVISDPVLLNMINKLSQLELEKESLLRTTGEQNSLIAVKNNQIENIRLAIIQNLQLQKLNLQKSVVSLQSVKSGIDINISSVPDKEKRLTEIIREKNIRESVYVYLLQKREEASISNASVFSKMRIIDKPYSSARPVTPNKLIVMALSLLSGLIVATSLINIKYGLASKVGSRQQVEDKIRIPVLGEVSRLKPFSYNVFGIEDNLVAEQFRRIRTYLTRLNDNKTSQVILVTSAMKGEGKATTCINLAISFALLNKKTALIDFDLRNPRLSNFLNTPVTNFTSEIEMDEYTGRKAIFFRHPSYPTLKIASVPGPGDKSSEITGQDLTSFFAQLRQQFQYVVILTPAAAVFTDALQLEKYCDTVLFIVRQNYTSVLNLEYLGNSVEKREFKNAFIIYNDVPVNKQYKKNFLSART